MTRWPERNRSAEVEINFSGPKPRAGRVDRLDGRPGQLDHQSPGPREAANQFVRLEQSRPELALEADAEYHYYCAAWNGL
jgi:hypothetical protein